MADITDEFALHIGRVLEGGGLFFLTDNVEASSAGVPNGQLFYRPANIGWRFSDFPWIAVDLVVEEQPELLGFALGRDGEVLVGTRTGFSEERIDDDGASPLTRGPVRALGRVSGETFAVGMGRQIYHRTASGWRRFEEGIPQPPPPPAIVGFNTLVGYSLDEMYVFGWAGEAWSFDGSIWRSVVSPTDVLLFDALVYDEQTIFVCGQSGILLRGRGNAWGIVDYDGPARTWRSMARFGDHLFLSDGTGLFVLDGNDLSEVLRRGEQLPAIHVSSTSRRILATGSDRAWLSTDGEVWEPIDMTATP